MTVALPRGKQVTPQRHPILARTVVVGILGKLLIWHDVLRLPLRHLLGKRLLHLLGDIVLGARRPEASDLLVAGPSALGLADYDLLLVDDGVGLLAHLPSLRLPFYLVAADDSPTIWVGAQC